MKISLILAAVFLVQTANAQTDSARIQGETAAFIKANSNPPEMGSTLFNGVEHVPYPPSIAGSAYLTDEWRLGSVVYEGIEYPSVQIKLDMVKEELLVRHPDGLQVVLFTPRVEAFMFDGRKFINLPKQTAGKQTVEGFFEVLHEGPVLLLAKRKRVIEERVSRELERNFANRYFYIAEKAGVYHYLKNENALLDLVPEKKNEIKKFLREQHINYKNSPELTLTSILTYSNQSSN